ncbi:M48 family metallopeptidase [Bacillus sp. B1-b2]|uniref:M48 family metallopeptidase n=1 Tax=Bacillus sp. B1-b2 TaxID=2653201 RepID=UPI00126270F0|nr:M48 family metallopeptidase [Bacillus sp. B1-b2]KAB7665374.1 M48 family metallopeptidase [Bacillus sp. B1-b2]
MTRKIGFYAVLIYVLYGLFFYWYLFQYSTPTLPFEFQGTSSDPSTFLNSRELVLSEEYSRVKNFLFFISTPFEWLLYLFILLFGVSKVFKKWGEDSAKYKMLQTAIYLFWLNLTAYILTFPISYIGYSLSKTYHISTQGFSSWMKDELVDFWINFLFLYIIVSVLYWLMSKSKKRWWLYAWLLSIPFTLFITFIQPVIIDPLYNEFTPLKDKELEAKILELASASGIPADHVFEVNMSDKTNALNAYVTGIGSNARIVLWDTSLKELNEDEILFVMAHEMAHYVEKHIYIGIAISLAFSLLGLYLIYKLMHWLVKRWGKALNIRRVEDIQSFPLILLLISMLSFAVNPFSNLMSRYEEKRADEYAVQLTQNPESGITTFQKLAKSGLSEVNPPVLVKVFRYSHPTMLERISKLEEESIELRNKE